MTTVAAAAGSDEREENDSDLAYLAGWDFGAHTMGNQAAGETDQNGSACQDSVSGQAGYAAAAAMAGAEVEE